MEELGLDAEGYVKVMADTLAFLHWEAKIDAADIEFVLAPPREDRQTGEPFTSDTLGEHAVWILDFDCCRPMTMDDAGIEKAARCFYRNDPFYPRPGRDGTREQRLWEVFRKQFLDASNVILADEEEVVKTLPHKLISKIEGQGELMKLNQV